MPDKSVFISHIAEEAGIADALKTQIESALPGLRAFSSSSDIGLGAQWLAQIDKALQKADALLILCSRRSVERRWINFEAGAGWGRKKPVIPVDPPRGARFWLVRSLAQDKAPALAQVGRARPSPAPPKHCARPPLRLRLRKRRSARPGHRLAT